MSSHDSEAQLEIIAWQVMIVSVFRHTERQTLNLLLSLLGISSLKDATRLLEQIFELVRKGIIYIPEARLEIFHEAPELVDVYLIKEFDVAMRHLVTELSELRVRLSQVEELDFIPQKVHIDWKNYVEGKYIH
ncbi:hypothetical protein CEE45_09735 [Candidatus Heimdallarchaeota archaeon B3_Heim]|nr:MAG: hypothetical protein CEE45_09735 [Candidatus Heimdallarchaeota archaeon B3_Heim]